MTKRKVEFRQSGNKNSEFLANAICIGFDLTFSQIFFPQGYISFLVLIDISDTFRIFRSCMGINENC